ncbi:gamma-glutamyl-gamma-aminobutyrate hydrolase family protein [Rhodanobacter sp. A1T4]|uniref:gamma-glutamyl-gamma-aminobutyrate hydrolase family protein n=1 Tax=Rhodanobacter sp. A1T4 TaxID=2723087 RepID=UPI00160E7E44|nr:gamma-glutamyl-gamma-aminobutyrate hydrolase family protein [Rhodanobacter sp. A1T4]MBB6246499.1 gamma-glutamyl-gamma-aminobutyrate hydrolase PuuD [Rhodanobacter sp. A1T4]
MGHRKFENPKQGETKFVKGTPRGFVVPTRPKPAEPVTETHILRRGGIVAGPYGTPGFKYQGGDTHMSVRPVRDRQELSSRISQSLRAQNPIKRHPITISHREDARGSGAFWDHYTMRTTTGRTTEISHHREVTPTLQAPGHITAKQFTGDLPGARPDSGSGFGQGLLFIAGGNYGLLSETPRNTAHIPTSEDAQKRHQRRTGHEKDLLKHAQLTGRPVLGICGGSWQVLESFGGSTRGVKPKTHQTRKMPYLTSKGTVAKVASEHGLSVVPRTMLSSAFRDDSGSTPAKVNSAHWAVAEESAPGRLKGVPKVGARKEPLLKVSARGSTALDPPYLKKTGDYHQQSVEAFESRHGAPVMGIQWHPEAYGHGFPPTQTQANQRLLNWMAKAGDAYEARREMTQEFSKWVNTKRLQPTYLAKNKAFQLARRNTKLGLK